ncbi:hypothetical protein MKW92_047697, partial [Papaver armeniacum]
DIMKNLKHHNNEDILKGQVVKNQKVLWDKTLEFRFLLQKPFSSSNKLPKFNYVALFNRNPSDHLFVILEKATNKAYLDLITSSEQTINCLLELQEALLEKSPHVAQNTDGNIKESSKEAKQSKSLDASIDKEWLPIQQMHSRFTSFRNSSIDKWQRNAQVGTGVGLGLKEDCMHLISEQVAAYMGDPSENDKKHAIKKIYLLVPDVCENGKEEDANMDGDPELLDDSILSKNFKEFLELYNPASSESAYYALKRLQTKKRKIVDRRASKCRKIRYHVHEKIVNFMAPEPQDLPPMAPKLFENLFGLKN